MNNQGCLFKWRAFSVPSRKARFFCPTDCFCDTILLPPAHVSKPKLLIAHFLARINTALY